MMKYLTQQKYSFLSAALGEDAFGVVEFRGREGLSECYEFQILLIADDPGIALARVVESPATFRWHLSDGRTIDYHGILLAFEQLQAMGGGAFYRATLAPRLHWLKGIQHHQVFLGRTVPEIIEACLKDGGLTVRDFEFRLQNAYPSLDYVCQYGESHLDFISRWSEREGIYYFFEQGPAGEKVIFTDSRTVHGSHPQGGAVRYAPPSALDTPESEETIRALHCRRRMTPAGVRIQDYNGQKPSMEVSGTAAVGERSLGQVYLYGEPAATPEEAERQARLRAETLLCRQEVFEAEGNAPALSAGYTFQLSKHFRDSFNQVYLALEIRHEGSQAGYLVAGLGRDPGEAEKQVYYRNRLQAIPAGVQFRPERLTPRPQVAGYLPAHVDGAGSGQYAELDEQGRYKVSLPFDLAERPAGKASAWFRRATPYAGSDHGMHFPLHKGTEVLLTFQDGDLDRPIIAAAVPNPETPSPVTGTNQTNSVILTGSGNRIQFEDRTGSERILLHSPAQSSFIRIGAPNDPPPALGMIPPTTTADPDNTTSTTEPPDDESWDKASTHWGIAEKTNGGLEMEARSKNVVVLGWATDWVIGPRIELAVGGAVNMVLGGNFLFNWRPNWKLFNLQVGEETANINAEVTHFTDELAEHRAEVAKHRVTTANLRLYQDELAAMAYNNQLNELNLAVLREENQTTLAAVRAKQQTVNRTVEFYEAVGTDLQEAAEEMETAGDDFEQWGTRVDEAETSVHKSVALMEGAGAIFETNDLNLEG